MSTTHPPRTRGAELLAAWLAASSTSQHALARRLGVSVSAVQHWLVGLPERQDGPRIPSLRVAALLEGLTGVPVRAWAEPPRKKSKKTA